MFIFNKKHNECTDEQLVQLLIGGDHEAFNKLYHRYNKRLLYYFYRMLGNSNEKAQDFLQDIFVKVIDKANTFDHSRKLSTWIFSIAHNMCKNEYRKNEIRKDIPIEPYVEHLLDDTERSFDEHDVNIEQFTRDLFDELETFDEIHKTAFLLHYRESFAIKDIGQILEISEGTVKSRLFYTRKRLSEKLVKYQTINNY
jgi:RNA polymerase sigma-70 factor (ECF subfamily)